MMLELLTYFIIGTICYVSYQYLQQWMKSKKRPVGTKTVPIVKGRLPLVGNGIEFSKDIVGFVRNCYKTYGPIFRLKIFRTEMIVVCDRNLTEEFFNKKEKDMSLNKVLDRLYFADAFAENPKSLDTIIRTVRSSVKVNFDQFAPKIMQEGYKMIEEMKNELKIQNMQNQLMGTNKCSVKLQDKVIKFIARTSSRCFVDFDMDDDFFETLMKFAHLLNKIVILTYFIPKWLLRIIFNPFLRVHRNKMIKAMLPTIQSYRDDPTKKDSLVIRRALDLDIAIDGTDRMRRMTNKEVGEVLICLLFVGSENTALALTATLLDLSNNPEYWKMVRDTTRKAVKEGDYRSIFSDKMIDSCAMESARMNSHIFALNRMPMTGINTLGDYFVGDVDCCVLSEPILMQFEASHDKFKDPENYNPDRFINGDEQTDSRSVMTWGSGVHLCPGKLFSLYEIKVGMAMLTNVFEPFTVSNSKKEYFSPSAYSEFTADVEMKLNTKYDDVDDDEKLEKETIGKATITHYTTEDGIKGWLIENYMSSDEQVSFYNSTMKLIDPIKDAKEQEIKSFNPLNPCPLAFHNLVYTKSSNVQEPTDWYEFANNLWTFMRSNVSDFKEDEKKFNSFYSQLFAEKSTMNMHKDEFVDWGISISIGSSAEFIFGNHKIKLHSGSIFISDFSLVSHGISHVNTNTTPGWFTIEETLERCRLSVQIRSIDFDKEMPKMEVNDFTKMINK